MASIFPYFKGKTLVVDMGPRPYFYEQKALFKRTLTKAKTKLGQLKVLEGSHISSFPVKCSFAWFQRVVKKKVNLEQNLYWIGDQQNLGYKVKVFYAPYMYC